MPQENDPPEGMPEGHADRLRFLARVLATGNVDENMNLWVAQVALINRPDAFDWLAKLFAGLNTDGQALRWLSPHRVPGELTAHTLAFAVGPADGSPEDNVAFYRLHDGTLTKVEPITDEQLLFPRLAKVLAWDMRDKLSTTQSAWHQAIMLQITDYQTRSLHTRVRRANGEVVLAHTNDATALSMRPLIAVIENYQNKDGSVRVPEVLRPYLANKITL